MRPCKALPASLEAPAGPSGQSQLFAAGHSDQALLSAYVSALRTGMESAKIGIDKKIRYSRRLSCKTWTGRTVIMQTDRSLQASKHASKK